MKKQLVALLSATAILASASPSFAATTDVVTTKEAATTDVVTTKEAATTEKSTQQVKPLDDYIRVSLVVNTPYTLSGDDVDIITGSSSNVEIDGKIIKFTAAGTYVIQVNGWFDDDEYIFTVTAK
ncbi:hypothetical protein E8L90_28515 [Brevibacillus antibioticus]|uniref:Uncharacterized protein n=2 Tax=Brevibacillus TaxID=55080 RepID=A0A220MKC0_9BACL|nr:MULTISPECIES: hypothetical protein [Brevibacillus]ASJ55536.1 hypothetical protein BP422_19495 [Brevibacillus formosus]TKI59018.1 hypothetical protein E8L90_28515 [Brevibacillus antibioticus]